MSSVGFKQRAFNLAQPLAAHLELTYRCNWRCVFCYNPRHSDIERMSAAEWLRVLDDLRGLGTLTLVLTGGEPLAHPEFFEIARAARSRGFALRILTNGSLIDDRFADEIAALLPMGVELSLHGATAEVHDGATGTAGSFEKMLEALRRLKRRGVPLLLKTPLTRANEEQLDAMIALAARESVSYNLDPTLTPRDDGDRGPLAYAASASAVRRLMERPELASLLVPTVRERGAANCGLGRITLAIDPEGNVFPCFQWRMTSLGNVRDTPLRNLWKESPARQAAAAVAVAANDALLAMSSPLSDFPYCPALAYQRTGDPLVPDEDVKVRAALAEEIRSARTARQDAA